jgi:predicted TIM-barrel fold metal-dependent hydrolase
MIIDAHVHLGRNEHINVSVDQLLRSMDKAKIDKSLVFAGELNDCPNDWMIEQIKPHRDRLFGVAAYHDGFFRYVDFKKMIEDNGLVGIKFYTGYEHFTPVSLYENTGEKPVSAYYHNPLQICSDLEIPAIFHCGDCLNTVKKAKLKYSHPLGIDEVAVDYDDVKFVIAHMAYPWQRDAAEVCYKNANVYADISGFVYGDFDAKNLVDFHSVLNDFIKVAGGTDKLLFGSDFPISNQKSYVETVEDLIGMKTIVKNIHKVFNLQ